MFEIFLQGDAVSRLVVFLLLGMSVGSWVVIFSKVWLLRRVVQDVQRSVASFWQAPSLTQALEKVRVFDRDGFVAPLILATHAQDAGTLAASGDRAQQLTRVLRDALHEGLRRLNFGQLWLATVGSTAPFVGLLGTVWGIYHALIGINGAGQMNIEKVAGPVGEALVMTAAGLFVAIPAVLAYNVLGRSVGRIETDLEGFAFDLREWASHAGANETP